jgi:hypothetical protein
VQVILVLEHIAAFHRFEAVSGKLRNRGQAVVLRSNHEGDLCQ